MSRMFPSRPLAQAAVATEVFWPVPSTLAGPPVPLRCTMRRTARPGSVPTAPMAQPSVSSSSSLALRRTASGMSSWRVSMAKVASRRVVVSMVANGGCVGGRDEPAPAGTGPGMESEMEGGRPAPAGPPQFIGAWRSLTVGASPSAASGRRASPGHRTCAPGARRAWRGAAARARPAPRSRRRVAIRSRARRCASCPRPRPR